MYITNENVSINCLFYEVIILEIQQNSIQYTSSKPLHYTTLHYSTHSDGGKREAVYVVENPSLQIKDINVENTSLITV